MPKTEQRYAAFVSYSSKDQSVAVWLHRALERYRTPRSLVGTDGLHGKVPRRIRPIFRDRDELASSEDLGATIRQALEGSAHLVVVCSRHARTSRWVNEEIVAYRSLTGQRPVSALIASGEPKAGDGASPDSDCFPPALKSFSEGMISDVLAADIRKHGDGKRKAKLKIAAAILGVNYDQLFRREKRRQFARFVLAAALIGPLIPVAFAYFQSVERRATQLQNSRLMEAAQRQYDLGFKENAAILSLAVVMSGSESMQGTEKTAERLLRKSMAEAKRRAQFHFDKPVSKVLISGDGRYVLSICGEDSYVSDVQTGKSRKVVGPSNEITAAAFDSTGSILALAERLEEESYIKEREIYLFRVADLSLIGKLKAPGYVAQMKFSDDSNHLSVATQMGAIGFDIHTQLVKYAFQHATERGKLLFIYPLFVANPSANASVLLTVGGDGNAYRWDTKMKREDLAVIGSEVEPVRLAEMQQDGSVLAVSGRERLSYVVGNKERAEFSSCSDEEIIEATKAHNKVIAVSRRSICVWDAETKDRETKIPMRSDARTVAISQSSGYVAVGFADGRGEVWDPIRQVLLTEMRDTDVITSLSLSKGGDVVVSGAMDGTVSVWTNSEDFGEARFLGQNTLFDLIPADLNRTMAFIENGSESGDRGSGAEVKDLETGESLGTVRFRMSNGYCRGELGQGRRTLLTQCGNTSLTVFELPSGRALLSEPDHNGQMERSACISSCSQVVGFTRAGEITTWDVHSGKVVQSFSIKGSGVRVLAVSKGGEKALLSIQRPNPQLVLVDVTTKKVRHLSGDIPLVDGNLLLSLKAEFNATGQEVWVASSDMVAYAINTLDATIRQIDLGTVDRPSVTIPSQYGNDFLVQEGDSFVVYGRPSAPSIDRPFDLRAMSISEDASKLATLSQDKRIGIWDTTTGASIVEFRLVDVPKMIMLTNDGSLLLGYGGKVVSYPIIVDNDLARFAKQRLSGICINKEISHLVSGDARLGWMRRCISTQH